MTPSIAAAYDLLVQRAAERTADVARVRAAFEAAAGAYSPDDSFYEERAAALWDRVLTDPEVLAALGEPNPVLTALARAHRGLFAVVDAGDDVDLECLVTGAAFRLSRADSAHAALRQAHSEGERLDAFVVASAEGASLLPGVLVHPASARVAIERLVQGSTLAPVALLDALLGMRHRLATLGRMRPEVVYRWP